MMNLLRLLLFIPATIVSFILSSLIIGFLIDLLKYFEGDFDLLRFLWQPFVQSFTSLGIAFVVGVFIFPYENKKLIPLLILSVLFIGLEIFLYEYLQSIQEIFLEDLTKKELKLIRIEFISHVLGILGSFIYSWKIFYFDER